MFSNLLHVFPWGSIISLMVLSLTRVIIVIFPLGYKVWVTRRRMMYVITGKYLFIAVFLAVSNPLWTFIFLPAVQSCFVTYSTQPELLEVPHVNAIPYIILIGSVVIVLLSALVIGQVWRNQCRGRRNLPAGFQRGSNHIHNIARELVLLVVVYLLTTFSVPLLALAPHINIHMDPDQHVVLAQVAKILFYVGPVANPLIYTLRHGEYRETLTSSLRISIGSRGRFFGRPAHSCTRTEDQLAEINKRENERRDDAKKCLGQDLQCRKGPGREGLRRDSGREGPGKESRLEGPGKESRLEGREPGRESRLDGGRRGSRVEEALVGCLILRRREFQRQPRVCADEETVYFTNPVAAKMGQ